MAKHKLKLEILQMKWKTAAYLRDEVEQSIPRKCPNSQAHKQL